MSANSERTGDSQPGRQQDAQNCAADRATVIDLDSSKVGRVTSSGVARDDGEQWLWRDEEGQHAGPNRR